MDESSVVTLFALCLTLQWVMLGAVVSRTLPIACC